MAIPGTEPQRDQAAYIESTKDGGVDRRVNDGISHDKLDAIIAALGGSNGTPFFVDVQSITTPGTLQTLVNETVPVGKSIALKSVRITSRQHVTYEILIDSQVVGSGRIGSGNLNDDFVFNIERSASAGSVIKVEILSNSGRPATDVECYLQGLES